MSYKNHPSLLPNGLSDLLHPVAAHESALIESFMCEFSRFGYLRVKPPLVEFEDSLLSEGPGQSLARQTFRLMDPVSGRMMGVRADVTAQIARIATSRLLDAHRPLRLSYAADVLRVNGTQLRPDRQLCQVGCEMIGDDSVVADVECALVALKGLSSAGIKSISIDLTVPTIIHHIFEDLEADEGKRHVLSDLIGKRDVDAVQSVESNAAPVIASLMTLNGQVHSIQSKISDIDLPVRARQAMDRLMDVAEQLRGALDVYGMQDIAITLDPLEHRGLEYHTGVSFSIFASGARGEIGSGGRYNIAGVKDAPETATGFTLYMDNILKVTSIKTPDRLKELPHDALWQDIKSAQDEGFVVIRQK